MSDALAGLPPAVVERYHLDHLPFDQVDRAPDELMRLSGRRVIVTGGAGPALGQAIVHRLAALGARVAVADIDGEAAAAVAAAAADRWNADTFSIQADVTDWDSIHAAVATTARRLGGLDVLVNNAGGVLGLHGPFIEQDARSMRRLVELNLIGSLFASKAALTVMLPQHRGRIITISSEGGKISMDGLAIYNACKAGLIGFTRNLARELRHTGVSAVAVCPGPMIGPVQLGRLASAENAAGRAAMDETWWRLTADRFSLPEEVANMVAFLASEAGAYLQGTAVSVGGGLSD